VLQMGEIFPTQRDEVEEKVVDKELRIQRPAA
jgi:hypothetical protein